MSKMRSDSSGYLISDPQTDLQSYSNGPKKILKKDYKNFLSQVLSYARLNCQWLSWENRNGISKEEAQVVLIWFMKTKEWKTMDLYWLNCTPSKSPFSATSWAILWWRWTKLFVLSDVRVNKIINTENMCLR